MSLEDFSADVRLLSPCLPCANPDFCQCISLLSAASTKSSKELKTSLKRHPHSKNFGSYLRYQPNEEQQVFRISV